MTRHDEPDNPWNGTRIAAFVLTLGLGGLGIYLWRTGGDRSVLLMLCIGAALGLTYTIAGSLPRMILWAAGGKITADDDPRNLSPRLYLPILGAVILVAVILYLIYGRG